MTLLYISYGKYTNVSDDQTSVWNVACYLVGTGVMHASANYFII
jgi:hypothetical protein